MKKLKSLMANLLIVAMLVTMVPIFSFGAVTNVSDFRDMPNDWSTDALQKAVTNGLISGFEEYGLKYIKPNDNLTRAQMATIVNRAFGAVKLASITNVNDIPTNEWFAPEMAKAVKMGTFKIDAYMRPNDPITRQEAFTVLARALRLSDRDNGNSLYNFTDGSKVADYAKDSVCAMIDGKYVAGSNGYLYPASNMSRAEFAKVMDNLIKDYSNNTGEVYTVSSLTGNLMINVPGVTIKNTIIKGDLIIGDGVGTGNVTLDNVDVTGRTIIRGGGLNTVRIKSNCDIPSIIIAKVDGNIRVLVDSGGIVDLVNIDDGDDDVVLEGDFGTVNVNKSLPVYFVGAEVNLVQVNVTATINVDEDSIIDRMNAVKTATGTKAVNYGIITKLVSDIKVTVSGTGTVTENLATGGNVALISIGTITGTPKVGVELTAGTIKPSGATVNYQWKRASTVNGTYSNISGATSRTYTPVVNDLDKFLKVAVTGKNNYTGTLTSNATTVVTTSKITATTIAVTAPVLGATPVSTLSSTAEYTATVTWTPTTSPFAADAVYTATITLTPKTGYTLTGITANQFKVAGATTVTNPVNSGTITAVFPATSNNLATGLSPVIGPVSTPEEGKVMLTVSSTPQSGHKIYYRVVDSNPSARIVGSTINLTSDSPLWSEVTAQTAIKISAADGKYVEVVEVTDATTKSVTKWGKTGATNDGYPVLVEATGLTVTIAPMSPITEGSIQMTSVNAAATDCTMYYRVSTSPAAPYVGTVMSLASGWISIEGTSVAEIFAIDGKFVEVVEVSISDSRATRWGVSSATDDGYTPPLET